MGSSTLNFGKGDKREGRRLEKQILEGIKTTTSQVHRYGKKGDIFKIQGVRFMITSVRTMTLGQTFARNYKKEGCSSPAQFKKIWMKFHRYRDKWPMNTKVYVYGFERAGFAIRETAQSDFAAVNSLLKRTGMLHNALSKAVFSRILSRNGKFCLVATDGEKVVGSVFGFDDVLTLHISKLAVDESYRRRGIGVAMMKELMRRSKKGQKFDFIFLHVAKKNKGAVALYRSLGFEDRNSVHRFMDI